MKYARRQMSWWRGREEIKWFKTAEEMLEAYDADSALATTE
jgi:tRNA A37 N6-isopentenylltransferase MiaA